MNSFIKCWPLGRFQGTPNAKLVSLLTLILTTFLLFHQLHFVNDLNDLASDEVFMAKLSGPLDPSDDALLKYTYGKILVPPSEKQYDLKIYKTDSGSQIYTAWRRITKSPKFLYEILQTLYPSGVKTKGFFVEAGAYDGEMNSNSLYLELELGWTGLLVEPDEQNFQVLLSKNRKAWSCQCCLSPRPYPYETILASITETKAHKVSKLFTTLLESRDSTSRGNMGYTVYRTVQCLPLQTLLLALNRTHVDVISLDIEDLEFEVLRAFPMSQINVDVWMVEHRNPSNMLMAKDSFDQDFVHWFDSKGYLLYRNGESSPIDYIFIKRNSAFFEKNHKRLNLK